MPLFLYKAVNQQGKKYKGTVFAYSREEAVNKLRSQGSIVTNLEEQQKSLHWWNRPVGSVSFKDKIVFLKYLATILESGLSLKKALETLAEQTKNKFFRDIIADITTSIENGQSFSESLRRFPKVFNEIFVSMVAAGEVSGNLSQTLRFLEKLLTKIYRFQKKLIGAMAYPVVVLVIAVGVVVGIVRFIVPQLLPIFSSFGSELPLPTRILIFSEKALSDYWYFLILMVVFIVLFVVWGMKIRNIRLATEKVLLKIPFIGPLIKRVQITRFTQICALLLKSGLTFIESLTVASKTIKNLTYREYLLAATAYIESGGLLSEYLQKRPDLFDVTFVQMVALGQETGNLEKTLEVVAELNEDEVNSRLKIISELIGPIVLLVVGGIIALIAVSVIGPIYRLPSLIKQ